MAKYLGDYAAPFKLFHSVLTSELISSNELSVKVFVSPYDSPNVSIENGSNKLVYMLAWS